MTKTNKINSDKKEQLIKFCPKCKSPDVFMDYSNPLQPAAGLPPLYICRKCNHTSNMFPEIPISELDSFEKEVKKENLIDSSPDNTQKVDTSYGDFEVRFIWKIVGPIYLVLGIILYFMDPTLKVISIIMSLVALFIIYITYFKKRKLKEI